MKTKLLFPLAALALIANVSTLQAANLFWDPSGSNDGQGSGNWRTFPAGAAVWDTGGLGGASVLWNSFDTANFQRTGVSGGTATMLDNIIASQVNILTTGYTIEAATTNTNLVILGPGTFATNGNTVQLLANQPSGDVVFQFGGGVTGAGTITLNKATGVAGTNFTIKSGGNISANTVISSGATGLVGYTATADIGLTGNITNGSSATTLLAANPTKTLTVQATSVVSGSSTLQVGTATDTGTIALASGSTVSSNINVVGGTLLSQGSNIIGNSSNMTLNGTTLAFGNSVISETLGTLTLTQSSVIDLGNGAVDLHFAASDIGTWTGTLEIWNWTPLVDHVYFGGVGGTGLAGLDVPVATQTGYVYGRDQVYGYTDNIKFYYGSGTGLANLGTGFVSFPGGGGANLSGEIVPVPEPSAVMSLGLLLMVIGWKERRFFARSREARSFGGLSVA